jgi:lipopolysaccharide/colanic/teichoic acid biosynthesis glycosyltransferase
MSEVVRATSQPFEVAGADPLDVQVQRIAEQTDWQAFLPARAAGAGWRAGQWTKRVIDVVLAAVGIVVLSPLLLLIAVAVRIDSNGPVLYRIRVLGWQARPFVAYKFRTMVENADELKPQLLAYNEMSGPVFKIARDPRVTRLGRFLRKYSFDELPQLYNVLRGEMSLVGPRPPGPHEFVAFKPEQRGKLAVIPGMTCIWQVTGRSHIRSWDEWARLDLQYVREWSLRLDFVLLLRTIPVVLRGDGAY